MSDLPSDWRVRCRSGVECSHPLGLACRISVLSEPGGEPFAEKLALSSRAESRAQQRGALAQGEPTVRRSAPIACVRAPNASRVKRWRAHLFGALARAIEAPRIVYSQVGHFWRAQLGRFWRALKQQQLALLRQPAACGRTRRTRRDDRRVHRCDSARSPSGRGHDAAARQSRSARGSPTHAGERRRRAGAPGGYETHDRVRAGDRRPMDRGGAPASWRARVGDTQGSAARSSIGVRVFADRSSPARSMRPPSIASPLLHRASRGGMASVTS
jgi:hypothetical protein